MIMIKPEQIVASKMDLIVIESSQVSEIAMTWGRLADARDVR